MSHQIIGIIPTRINSSRLPAKLLLPIMGKSLLQRTYENARLSPSFNRLIVATYEDIIFEHVKAFGGEAIFTASNCMNGSDCSASVLEKHPEFLKADVIINIQGDEPCVSPECFDLVSQALLSDPLASMATIVTKLDCEKEALSPHIVKCVKDKHNNALYFSRQLIPSNKSHQFDPTVKYYRHIGIYAFRPAFLLEYKKLSATPLQQVEDLEQLKILEHGYRIKVAEAHTVSIGVDVPEDIHKVEQWLCKQNISSLQAESVLH